MARLRITGGAWRSRRIATLDAPGLRPTPDRVRETLFNWLGQDLSGLAVLDLFAGTGILGLEAASRGASRVSFVERDGRIFAALRRNLALFAERAEAFHPWRGDALEFAASAAASGVRFDLILLDPPYRQGWLDRLWPWLGALSSPEGWLYVEAEAPIAAPAPWHVARQGRAGQVFFHLLTRDTSDSP